MRPYQHINVDDPGLGALDDTQFGHVQTARTLVGPGQHAADLRGQILPTTTLKLWGCIRWTENSNRVKFISNPLFDHTVFCPHKQKHTVIFMDCLKSA